MCIVQVCLSSGVCYIRQTLQWWQWASFVRNLQQIGTMVCMKSFVYFLPMPSDKGYKAWPACVLGATDWQCHRHDCEITVLAKFKQLKKIYIHSAFFCSPSPPLHDINLLCKNAEIQPFFLTFVDFCQCCPFSLRGASMTICKKLAKLQWQCIVILAKTSCTL